MRKRLNHLLQGFYWWLEEKSSGLSCCEICNDEPVARVCIGCDKYIGYGCDSLYYADETLCTECRSTITPEEEAQDRIDAIQEEAQ